MPVRYTKDHEYISVEGDSGTVGITDYAQSQLGDVVFVELPDIGRTLKKGVKAASEVFAPVSGTVTEVNPDLEGAPAIVNEDPAGRGWFIKMELSDPAELDGLMTEDAYAAFVQSIS